MKDESKAMNKESEAMNDEQTQNSSSFIVHRSTFIQPLSSIKYKSVTFEKEVRQILRLQKVNLAKNLDDRTISTQGFVTVEHNPEVLLEMNRKRGSIIAKDKNKLAGYALVMLWDFRNDVPEIASMFDLLDTIEFKNKPFNAYKSFAVGQVCVAESYRGQGVFDGMYAEMKKQFSGEFDFTFTEIATRNTRSMRAHQRVGFQSVYKYTAQNGEEWDVVVWEWK